MARRIKIDITGGVSYSNLKVFLDRAESELDSAKKRLRGIERHDHILYQDASGRLREVHKWARKLMPKFEDLDYILARQALNYYIDLAAQEGVNDSAISRASNDCLFAIERYTNKLRDYIASLNPDNKDKK